MTLAPARAPPCRQPADRHAPAAGVPVGPRAAAGHHRQPSRALRRRGHDAAPHHRRVDHGGARGAAVLRRGRGHPPARCRRDRFPSTSRSSAGTSSSRRSSTGANGCAASRSRSSGSRRSSARRSRCKLNAFDDTGAIIAAMTTSVPEAPSSGRNWDYRHCWLRDGYFVVNALNRLGATSTMERYLQYLVGIAAAASDGPIQPVYRISGSGELDRAHRGCAARLSRHGTGARRQRRVAADPARRLRVRDPRGHARVLRRATDASRRRRPLRAPGAARASVRSPCTTRPTRDCGSCAARRACTRSRA